MLIMNTDGNKAILVLMYCQFYPVHLKKSTRITLMQIVLILLQNL